MKMWTCIRNIALHKGLTTVNFYQGIDALGETRYIVRKETYGCLPYREEVTKEGGNILFKKLLADGYKKIWERTA